ncbi:MAG: hypothetical protein JXQ73_33640 [Phycisphaerae bacterium]|nr:hypothetical protein [Phycisphaerae bacterium]
MSCPDTRTWNLLSMDLLDEDRAASLRRHSLECERCRTARQEASREHADLLDALEAFGRDHDQRRQELMAMLPEPAASAEGGSHAGPGRAWIGGIAMTLRRHKARWAAVALAPAAGILLVFLLMAGEKNAFADVLREMRQARTMTCDFVTTITVLEGRLPEELAKEPMRGTMSMYSDGDTRALLCAYEQWGRKMRFLLLGDRGYVWDGETARVIQSGEKSEHWATEDWLGRLLEVSESPDRELGEQVIEGRRTVGFEIAGWKLGYGARPMKGSAAPADSDLRLRVWVDVERNLPIRMEVEQGMVMPDVTATMHIRWDHMKWDVALDAEDFRPPAEEDIAKEAPIQLPAVDEGAFVEGMRAWLELKDKARGGVDAMKKKAQEKGEEVPAEVRVLFDRAALDAGYPERLDMSWLSGTFGARAALGKLAETLSALKPIPKDVDEAERVRLRTARAMESGMATGRASAEASVKAMAVAAFYQKLANGGRHPEYFGATVRPGDSQGVLLRWKLDDGGYRVIYGDLRAETVGGVD